MYKTMNRLCNVFVCYRMSDREKVERTTVWWFSVVTPWQPQTRVATPLHWETNLWNVQLALPKECSKVGRSLHPVIHVSYMLHISGEICNGGMCDTMWCHIQYVNSRTYWMHASKDFLDSSPFSWVKAWCAFPTISSMKGDPSLVGTTTDVPHTSTEGS